MNLRQIEVFRAVMLTGSISGASQLLYVSQPAVSRLLAYTEMKVGLPLFERIKGRLYPTPEARLLFQKVDAVYHSVQRVNETVVDLLGKRGVALRLCCSPSLSQTLLPRPVARLSEIHPDVRIYLDTRNMSEIVDALLTQQFELGVSIEPIDHPNLECRPLTQIRMLVALPAKHRLARHRVLRVADLQGERLISYSTDTPLGRLLASVFHHAGIDLKPAVEIRHTHTACALVQAGAGVAIIDEMTAIGQNWPYIVVRALEDPGASITVCAVYSRFHPLSVMGRELLSLLMNIERPGVA
jgi:DNA-binding transcriptional LysR family regulator